MNKIIVTKSRQKKVEKFLTESNCEVNNLQTYFPTLCIFERNNKKYSKWITADLKNKLVDVADTYNNIGIVESENGELFSTSFHIKYAPMFDSLLLLKDSYIEDNKSTWLPTRKSKIKTTNDKITSPLNSAYIEAICSILTTSLNDSKYCPHFGSVYGLYNGIIEDYEADFSEEYDQFKHESWFQKAIKRGKCEIKFSEFADDDSNANAPSEDSEQSSEKSGEVEKKTDNGQAKELKNGKNSNIYNRFGFNEMDMDVYCSGKMENLSNIETHSIASSNNNDIKECKITHRKMPVQIFIQEKFDFTFEELFHNLNKELKYSVDKFSSKIYNWVLYIKKKVVLEKLSSWIFQICVALSCGNHFLHLVHNDLHVQNVMGKKTNEEFIYYRINDNLYKVPTHGYVMKIIDFGRSTFKYNDQILIGDVFSSNGEAGEQYTYPYEQQNIGDVDSESENDSDSDNDDEHDEYDEYDKAHQTHPKFSFDLARFSCSLLEEIDASLWNDFDDFPLGELIMQWGQDDSGMNLLDIEGFDLYKHISRFVNHDPPIKQLESQVFHKYKTAQISKNERVYNVLNTV
jgi:hypothetical protein